MGKVQKKATEKHKLSLSPAISDFIEKATILPLAELPAHLRKIPSRWPFPRGDLYNWIGPLDRFDGLLQKFNKIYGLDNGPQTKPFGLVLLLEGTPGADESKVLQQGFSEDGDRELIEAILSFSRLLLEKCGNRTLYNSTEHLNGLLNTTSLSLLQHTLRLTVFLAQRFAARPGHNQLQQQFYHYDVSKLQKLAAPLASSTARRPPQSPVKSSKSKDKASQTKARRASTTVTPNDFRALCQDPNAQTVSDQEWQSWANVKVVWSSMATSSAGAEARSTEDPVSPTPLRRRASGLGAAHGASAVESTSGATASENSGLQQFELSAPELLKTSPEEVLREAPEGMPPAVKYELLHKLRVAYALVTSSKTRCLLLENRLTALGVLGHIYADDEFSHKYFDGDANPSARQQLVHQIVSLLRESKKGQAGASMYIQTLAMETLCILSRQRTLSSEILSSLAPNSSHGLLMSLVQKGLEDIAHDGDGTDDADGDDWREAIFTLYGSFMMSTGPHHTRSSEAIVHPSLITAYASGLKIITGKSLRIHLRILDFMKNFFHHFRDGLQALTAAGAFETACECLEKLSTQALELLQAGDGIPAQFKTKVTDYQIPYMHQQVIRSLIDLVNDVSTHQGNHADRALRSLVDSASLLNAFRLILSHMAAFGAHTWSEIVKAVCSFLNNEPTSYTVVSEAGIIKTLLETIHPHTADGEQGGDDTSKTISAVPSQQTLALPAIADAVVNLATAFGPICLTESGHNQFMESGVLERFFQIFESPAHVKVIKDSNTLALLGSTFDELVRHHPGLKDSILSAVITMVARVRYVCRSLVWDVGAGPKLWVDSPSGMTVAGGADALAIEIVPFADASTTDFAPITLPNGNTLVSGPVPGPVNSSLAQSASDHDQNGLSAIDFARPAICFLLNFFENQSLCKDVLAAGATDLILDFITLPSLPVDDESFGPNGIVHELASLVHMMAEEKVHLVLPALVDRARYACTDGLERFISYRPRRLQCFFEPFLQLKPENDAMEVESADTASPEDGTRLVKSMMVVYFMSLVLAEVFNIPIYPSRSQQNTLYLQVNLADVFAELIRLLGSLSAACHREEIALQRAIPEPWRYATRPGNYSTGDLEIDKILNVSDEQNTEEQAGSNANSLLTAEQRESLVKDQKTAAFKNVKVLRYLLIETPGAISEFSLRIGRSIAVRKRPDTLTRQKIVMAADALASAYVTQLEPPFLNTAFITEDEVQSRQCRFDYLVLVLSNVRNSLYDDSSSMGPSSARQAFVINSFKNANGMKILTDIGTQFFNELKSCQVAQSMISANTGLKICLEIFEDFTNWNNITSSAQAAVMKSIDKERAFYFNPSQLLLELRMEALSLTRLVWDSEYAEQASNDVVRKLINILKYILVGEGEADAFRTPADFPKAQNHTRRKFQLDDSKVAALKEKEFPEDLAREAVYRCSGISSNNSNAAEEYCKITNSNPRRRSLPIPEGDVDSRNTASSSTSQLASPPSAPAVGSGVTTTIFEDISPEIDVTTSATDLPDHEPIHANGGNRGIDVIRNARQRLSAASAMQIRNILNDPSPPETLSQEQLVPTDQSSPRDTVESIKTKRESIREDLAERCNNILSNHQNLTFELNDLINAATQQLSEEAGKVWLETATEVLVMSLVSHKVDSDMTETQGKKIAATAHLIGLLCGSESFKASMLKVLQDSFDDITSFLRLPAQKPASEDAYPWIAPILLIIEKMLALDSEPADVKWNVPTDLETPSEPEITRSVVLDPNQKETLLSQLLDILPKVGKDNSMALSIVRVIVILTKNRDLALLQGQKKNLQKLFLMVKQLGNCISPRFQSAFMMVLRHIIEDDETVKQIMRSEIVAAFQSRTLSRPIDLTSYVREMYPLVLRSPELFVEVTNEKVKLANWGAERHSANTPLKLKEAPSGDVAQDQEIGNSDTIPMQAMSVEQPTESVEATVEAENVVDKNRDARPPVVERPDGVIHFLLSELLAYREVEDKEMPHTSEHKPSVQGSEPANEQREQEASDSQQEPPSEPPEKARFKAEDHPIFMYRCFLMQCLTELLYSYNQTKIEFINFSRKADPKATTPSKPRSGVLNYLLNALVSSGYVDRDESIICKKRMATSDWAAKVVVALCTKTGEMGLAGPIHQRYSSQQQVEDTDTEPDLAFVRRFVLEHAIKAFKDAITSTEPMQVRYGRLLCLADLFNKLMSKPAGPEGSAGSHNTSHKMLTLMMYEKNLIAILTSAISDIDLAFPGAKKVIKFILRPLQELTTTATRLGLSLPESVGSVAGLEASDVISSASSDVSELDDEREETPDLYRNSALGLLNPDHHEDSDTSDDEDDDDDEEMFEDGYEDEMEYDEGISAHVNDGEVVSDEELTDTLDHGGPIEGLPGDVPMDIQFVVDHHHGEDDDNEDEEDSSDEDDDSSEDDDNENDDFDIEMDDDEDIVIRSNDGHLEGDDDGEEEWEDEDGDEDDIVEAHNTPPGTFFGGGLQGPDIGTTDSESGGLNALLRRLEDGGVDQLAQDAEPGILIPADDEDEQDDDDDDGEDGDDMDENDAMDYDQGFDMMLDDPDDFDDQEEWTFDEPQPPIFRRHRHSRGLGNMPGIFTRRILNEQDMHHHMLGPRRHHHATPGRAGNDDGSNPLLQRPETNVSGAASNASPFSSAPGMEISFPGGFGVGPMRGAPLLINWGQLGGASGMAVNGDLGGHGALLDAIMGAIQRGDQDFLRSGRLQFNMTAPVNDVRDLLRPHAPAPPVLNRQPREDPQRTVQFTPMLTISRWQEEARMLFQRSYLNKIQPVQILIMSQLVPLAQEEERVRRIVAEQERKAEEERQAQLKAEEERLRKEEEERQAKEKAEAEAKAKAEAEAQAVAEAEAQAQAQAIESEQSEVDNQAMEGVQSTDQPPQDEPAAPQEQQRVYTTIRGRQLDITGLSIDAEYLEALPEDLREEVIMSQYQERREQAQEGGNEAAGIDPEFLDALPADIRDELRHQEAQAQRRRERERARREAQNASGQLQGGEMDNDDFLATLDPAFRRAILAEQPPEILAQLNPQHAAEARAHARNIFYTRLPVDRDNRDDRGRRDAGGRDNNKKPAVQLMDKAGVATLLRLMFLQQQGSLKTNLLHILSDVCNNRQTRFEVVSLLLVILKEGSTDVTAVERSLASLSLRAKASGAQKTPQPLKRTLSLQPYAGVSEEVTPMLVVQQCLNTLSAICNQNFHIKTLFLREVDVTSGSKSKAKNKGKSKENKTTKYPINDLIALLDRRLIMDSSNCLHSLSHLLALITSPLASLMRQEKERTDAEVKKATEESGAATQAGEASTQQDQPPSQDADMTDVPNPSATEPGSASVNVGKKDDDLNKSEGDGNGDQEGEQEKKKPFEPPVVTDHNLQLITGIFVAAECGPDTFRSTIETLVSLSHIPGTKAIFGKELISHVHTLSQSICTDLDELLPSIRDAQSSADVQGAAAGKFSANSSDQVKLLRVLQALDYLSVPKKDEDSEGQSQEIKSILTMSYEKLMLGPLWNKLSECLTAVREKGDTISFANILLPLIESLMVVCKNTTLKDTPIAQQIMEASISSPVLPNMDDLEELFFKFTSEHRKILNDIVRQSPKLMQGSFSILVKNSKVLDFDNKRNYFNKQIHSRHHAQRQPQPPLQLNVRRDQVFLDSYKALYFKNAEEMKYGKLNIRFNGEEGVDAGGVTREWFQVLARGMFDPNYALFQPVASDRTTFHPNPLSRVNPEHLLYFKFIGRIIGKALHEGRVLDCHFSRAVYKRILGKSPNLKDLESNDVDYYKSLVWILENDITDILTEEFCVIENEFGEEKVIDLIPNGRDIAVTEENKKEYVQKLVEYRLTESVKEQLDNFLQGFHDIIPAELIAIFNEQELELLISGLPEIDVDDWKANTEYHNYNPSSQQIVWFWRLVKAMTNEERAKLLQFITGTSKVPLNGFKELEGVSGLTRCNIHKDPSTHRLPTSHTCFNQLDLPAYESFEVMKQSLTTAINLGADYFGFA